MTKRRRTREQITGDRFEIWLERFFTACGYANVQRNVYFRRSRRLKRQVDVCYDYVRAGVATHVMVEAKYRTSFPVLYEFSDGPKTKTGQTRPIENLVDEVIERMEFTSADEAMLITNNYYEKKLLMDKRVVRDPNSVGVDPFIYAIDGAQLLEACTYLGLDLDRRILRRAG